MKAKISGWKYEVVRAGRGRKIAIRLRKCWKGYARRVARREVNE